MVRHVSAATPVGPLVEAGEPTTDPLLRVIHRVAHREHLHSTTRPTQFTRRRPVFGATAHVVSGTTARKVTWS